MSPSSIVCPVCGSHVQLKCKDDLAATKHVDECLKKQETNSEQRTRFIHPLYYLFPSFLDKSLLPSLYCRWLLSMIVPLLADFHHQIVNSDSPIKIITVVSAYDMHAH